MINKFKKTLYLLEVPDFDSDEYVQATFSPPSGSPPPATFVQPEPIEEPKSKVSTYVTTFRLILSNFILNSVSLNQLNQFRQILFQNNLNNLMLMQVIHG
jgi:hypothetical protein